MTDKERRASEPAQDRDRLAVGEGATLMEGRAGQPRLYALDADRIAVVRDVSVRDRGQVTQEPRVVSLLSKARQARKARAEARGVSNKVLRKEGRKRKVCAKCGRRERPVAMLRSGGVVCGACLPAQGPAEAS